MRYVWLAVLVLVALDLLVAWQSLGPLCFPPDTAPAREFAECAAAETRANHYRAVLPWSLFVTGVALIYAGGATFRHRRA
jgi:hypothetical protein